MTPNEEKLIGSINNKVSDAIKLTLFETDHEINRSFEKFCEKLSQLVPKIRIVKDDGDPKTGPAIEISSGIQYQAIPTENELEPFLEALVYAGGQPPVVSQAVKEQLKDIQLPAIVKLYVAPQCKFCPGVVRQLLPLPVINSNIRLTIVDCTQFPDAMEANKIKSVPTIILDDRFRWTGQIDLNEIISMMKDQDPGALSAASLEMMIADGNAGQLAGMMIDAGQLFPAFFEVLTHYSTFVRLGAMMAMEELIEEKPALAVGAITPLWERFSAASESVQGDILYILGEIGHPDARIAVDSVLGGDYSAEVKEAAEEALEKIKNHA